MEYFLSLLWTFLEVLGCLLFADAFFVRKRKGQIIVFTFLGLWLVTTFLSRILSDSLTHFVVIVTLTSAASIFSYKGKWIYQAICIVLSILFGSLFDVVMMYGFSAILGISFQTFMWMQLLYSVMGTMSKCLFVLIAYIIWRIRNDDRRQSIQSKWLLLTLLFPILSAIMVVVIADISRTDADLSMNAVFFSAILAVANVAILYLLNLMEKATKKEQEFLLMSQQMDIQTKNYMALEESFRAQRTAVHEFKNQMQTLQNLLTTGQAECALNYISQLYTSPIVRVCSVDSKHPVIDAVLNRKIFEARNSKIEMQMQVNDLSNLNIREDALVVLLSNLLDNAIEACQRMDGNRSISCSVLLEESLYISVRNTSLPVVIDNGMIETSKEPPEEHGYGLKTVYNVLQLLHGEYAMSYENGWFQFVAEISF